MSDLWTVRRDYSHVITHEDARVIGHALLGDPEFLAKALRAGAIEADVPGFGRAVFGIEWNLELLTTRHEAIRAITGPAPRARLDQAVEEARRDSLELARHRREIFERFAADYIDPSGTAAKVPGSVAGAAFAAILPAMGPDGATEEFARSVELMARELLVEPVALLWEPIEEILNWLRPGHLWQTVEPNTLPLHMPAQRPREGAESAQAARRA